MDLDRNQVTKSIHDAYCGSAQWLRCSYNGEKECMHACHTMAQPNGFAYQTMASTPMHAVLWQGPIASLLSNNGENQCMHDDATAQLTPNSFAYL